MPEKKKPQSPGEIYDRRAMALANALEARRDGGDPRGENPRMDDRSFALAQAARRAIGKDGFTPLAAGERGLERLPPYQQVFADIYAEPEVRTQQRRFGRDVTFVSGYDDEEAMRRMLRRPANRARGSYDDEAMRAALFRPGEGRATVMASDLPITTRVQPKPGELLREPGGRSGLIPAPPYVGDYSPSYDWESDVFDRPAVPDYEGGVSRFRPERLPEYRQNLRHAIADESLLPSDGNDRTARANMAYADSPAGNRPFNPGERERLAAPQKRQAAKKKGK